MQDKETKEKRNILDYFRMLFGFYRNPPYVEEKLKAADIRAALFTGTAVAVVEIWMILRYVKNWVLPGKVESVGEFFYYTRWYWYLLAASVAIIVYSALFLNNKLRVLNKVSRLVIFLFFAFSIYFAATTSMKDFSKGRMVTCFLTMLMFLTVICVWRPFTSLLLILVCGNGFVFLLNNYTFAKDGTQIILDEGDRINFVTFIIVLIIIVFTVYFQRYGDAWKSYRLMSSSVTDDLTGLPNLRKFEEEASEYAASSEKLGKHPIYLVFDITNFKTYNDRFGYSGGDLLLVRTGQIIKEAFPDEPVARESGDYFCALTNAEDFTERIDGIRRKLKEAYPEETYLDIKAGGYLSEYLSKDTRHAIDRARYALKKISGRSDIAFREYDQKMSRDYSLRQYVLNNIDKAVREGYIKVFYQPVMWSEDGHICGTEALARWDDPEMGFLSPGVFIPVLEEGRQIHKLDLCIYDQVCRRIRECLDSGLPVLPTSMNFSRLDFELMDAVGELEKLVEKYDIPKEYLHVEITESALTEDVEGLKSAMDRLHRSGYSIWLDDFGSGYSSMNVLKDFRFDLLKIDMEFLKNFSGNENSRKIISTIIELAQKLDMMTLSEGVETQEAVDFLREAGCGRLQGYFYGKPMPYEDIIAKIEDGTYRYAGADVR